MSMPEFPMPNPDMTRDQVLNMLLSSIALEELALSHIINAEGEKIQYTLGHSCGGGCPTRIADILSVNKSVTTLLEMVMQNQLLLKNKMEKVLEYLPKPLEPSCPAEPPCSPCPVQQSPDCFQVIPGSYWTCCAVQWCRDRCSCHRGNEEIYEKIPLPICGCSSANIALEFCGLEAEERIVAMNFNLHCFDRAPVCHLIYGTVSRCRPVLSRDLTLSLPCCKSPCYASLVVHSPCAIQLKQGYVSFA